MTLSHQKLLIKMLSGIVLGDKITDVLKDTTVPLHEVAGLLMRSKNGDAIRTVTRAMRKDPPLLSQWIDALLTVLLSDDDRMVRSNTITTLILLIEADDIPVSKERSIAEALSQIALFESDREVWSAAQYALSKLNGGKR